MDVQTHEPKTIHLATDHAGFVLKEAIRNWLEASGKKVVDHGAFSCDEQDDFPDFIGPAAAAVAAQSATTVAIVFGGSGQGEAMLANRFSNVRATVYYGGTSEMITLSRTHNDANVLAIGARFVTEAEAKEMIELWLTTSFAGEDKRVRRNQKLEQSARKNV